MEQMDSTAAKLSWPDLTNSRINATLLAGFLIEYSSAYLNDSCHEGSFVEKIKVSMYLYFHLNYKFCFHILFNFTLCSS